MEEVNSQPVSNNEKKPKLNIFTERTVKRNIVIKLVTNLILEIIAFGILITVLLLVQTQSVCNKQVTSSEVKLTELVENVASNTIDKNKLVDQYDDLHLNKASTLALYLRSNNATLDLIYNGDEETRNKLFKDTCAEGAYNIDSIYICRYDLSGSTNIVKSYSRDGIIVSFNESLITSYIINEDGSFKDTFIPFTYDHTNNTIIEYFENNLPEDDTVFRYHGCVINKPTSGSNVYDIIMLGSNPTSLYSEVHDLVSLQTIFKDATVGNEGYVFAIDKESGTIKCHPNESYIGKKYDEVGLTKDVLEDNYNGWQNFVNSANQKDKMFCVTSVITEEKVSKIIKAKYTEDYLAEHTDIDIDAVISEVSRLYKNVNVSVACISQNEINANRTFTAAIVGIVFILVATIQIVYLLIVKEDLLISGKQISKKISKHLYINDTVARRVLPITIIGILLIGGLTAYTQCLFSLSSQIDNNKIYLNEVSKVLDTNTKQTKNLKEDTEELYFNKLDVINYSIKADNEIMSLFVDTSGKPNKKRRSDVSEYERAENKTYFATLAESMGVSDIYLFNIYGEAIATSTNYQDFDLSTDPTAQSYAFWDVLKGHVTKYVQDPMQSDTEGYMQYMAKPIYTTYNSGTDADPKYVTEIVGMVQIGFEPDEYAEKIQVADIGNVLKNMVFGTKGYAFAINKSDSTIKYFPSSDASIDYTGKSYSVIGLPKDALSINYFGSATLVNDTEWISSMEYGDYYIYVAMPNNEVFSNVVIITVMTSVVAFITLSVLTLLYILNPTDESLETELVMKNRPYTIIRDSMGNERKVITAHARWSGAAISWQKLTPAQKLGRVIRGTLTICSIIVILMIFTNMFDTLSIISFIKSGNYTKGFNLFSITNVIVVAMVIIIGADLLRGIITFALRHADARVETVGRLTTNLIKYAAVIWVIFRSLSAVGVDTSSLITGASVLSIIIGLGSQSLISDILAGLFIVFEGEFRVGDIVTVGDWRGTVLEIGLRTTKIEDVSKNIKILTNSSITGVINMTKEYSYAGCTMSIDYEESIEKVEAVLSEELPKIKEKLPAVKDGPFYKGVSSLSDSSIDLKIIALCDEQNRMQLERDLNRELLLAFEKHNINIPFNQLVVSSRKVATENTVSTPTKKEQKEAKQFVEDQADKSKGIEMEQ